MSYKALFNKWLKSKKCKECSQKMELITVKIPKGDGNKWHADLFTNKILFRHGEKVDIFYAYRCAKCNLTIRLEDL
jgi:hypothetical protein